MDYRTLGRTGVKVSAISLGGWLTFGNTVETDTTKKIARRALDLGVNHIDTADVYAQGQCETALGSALAGVRRSSYVLGSKVFWPTGPGPNDRGLSRKHIMESCAASLARLKTDYLDLYYCHRYDPDVPLDETVRAMEDLVSQGRVLYWGVSCWTSVQIRDAMKLSMHHAPSVNQPPYNVFDRVIEKDVLATCAKSGLGVVVWSPLAQGVLTGKYLNGKPKGSRLGDDKVNKFMDKYLTPEATAVVKKLAALAKESKRTMGQLALGYCLRRPEVTSCIVGATSVEQIEENVKAAELPKDVAAEVERIAKDAPLVNSGA